MERKNDLTFSTPIGNITGRVKQTKNGKTVCQLLGIPYVQSQPVAENRFRRCDISTKLPADSFEAVSFGNAAIQRAPSRQLSIISPEIPQCEDCLTINIWTPSYIRQNDSIVGANQKLHPVFLFIHGGAFQQGTVSDEPFNGTNLCAHEEIVVVTFNYRLGILGFLDIPGVVEPNLGIRDQEVAIKWVESYIQYFGGDSENITLCGFSVGSVSVAYHTLNPNSDLNFNRAIMMSGALLGFFGFEKDQSVSTSDSREFLIQNGWKKSHQSSDQENDSIRSFLQNLPLDVFKNQFVDSVSGKGLKFGPVLDFDLQNVDQIQKKMKVREILVTSTHAEGEAFLYSLLGRETCDKLNKNDDKLYTNIITQMFSRFLPENSRRAENYVKICNFYRNKKVCFGNVEDTLFHKCALAIGNYLNDYPVLKSIQFYLKLECEARPKIYFKLHDYVQSDHKTRYFDTDIVPEYLNCSHGFEIPLLFNNLNDGHSDTDQEVSVKTMNLIGSVCRFDNISSNEREKLFGQQVKLNTGNLNPEIEMKNLSVSKSLEITTRDDLFHSRLHGIDYNRLYSDILDFWDGIDQISYQTLC